MAKRAERSSLIGVPYNPDNERFARLLDSMFRAGKQVGWRECYREHVEPADAITEAGRRALEEGK